MASFWDAPPPSDGLWCATCRDSKVDVTVRTLAGWYLRCRECGAIWHLDEQQTPHTPTEGVKPGKSDSV